MGYYEEHKTEVLEKMVEHLKGLPGGSFTSIGKILSEVYPENMEQFHDIFLNYKPLSDLYRMAKKNGIYLDMSKHDGLIEGLPFWLDFKVYKKRPVKKCPRCGSRNTAEILYGMPASSEELMEDLVNHRVFLGGCCISPDNPKYHCFDCKKDFGKPAIIQLKDGSETYERAIDEINFEIDRLLSGKISVTVKRCDGQFFIFASDDILEQEKELTEKEWQKFINGLFQTLYLHEWKKRYVNRDVMDGEWWSLNIKLTGKRVRNFYGQNDYPPYWGELIRMFNRLTKDMFFRINKFDE